MHQLIAQILNRSTTKRGLIGLVLGVLLSIPLLGCGKEDHKTTQHGFVETQFTDKDGVVYTYLVFIPYDYQPDQKRPLILFLNGKGENGVDGYWTIHNNFGIELWEMKRRFPFVCAIPQCPDETGWNSKNLQRAFGFADEVAKTYGTDEDRVYITGVSQGGQGVWNAISQSPERFAAAVPLCGTPHIDAKRLAESGLPIWNFYNQGDKAALVDANRQTYLALLEAGASPIYTEYKASGHNCWDRTYRSPALYQWLLTQRRETDRDKKSPFELLPAEKIATDWLSTSQEPWIVSEEGIAPSADRDFLRTDFLVSKEAYENFAWHVDAKFGPSCSRCRLALIDSTSSSKSSPQGFEIILPLAESGTGGVRTLNGTWISTLDPFAQRQLQADYSNDIRLTLHDNTLTVHINGHLAVDVPISDKIRKQLIKYRTAFVADPDLHWQYVRLRVDT